MNLYPREGTWLTLRFREMCVIPGEFSERANWEDPHRAVAYAFTRMPGWHGRHSGHMRGHDEGHRVPEFRTPDA